MKPTGISAGGDREALLAIRPFSTDRCSRTAEVLLMMNGGASAAADTAGRQEVIPHYPQKCTCRVPRARQNGENGKHSPPSGRYVMQEGTTTLDAFSQGHVSIIMPRLR
jgi:hypothetical protein